jgi:aminoglycoside/choline kinase family phosphotransferase
LEQIKQWLNRQGIRDFDIAPASSDASFRRYFRCTPADGGDTRIIMDAPPDKEDCTPFIHVTGMMLDMGLNVPRILARDLDQGFLMLTDLGSEQYLDHLNDSSAEGMYGDAILALLKMHQSGDPRIPQLPPYDRELLMREMELFREWLLGRHLGLTLSDRQQAMLDRTFALLADHALDQPRVFVHRDYHSRNLMVSRPNPGILDYQDAVYGPLTYDLVSLLRDCYIAWPPNLVEVLLTDFYKEAAELPQMRGIGFGRFLSWFDLMGVQRHLKASGIFARLNHRDGKPGYLQDIPRTLNYILMVAGDYPPLDGLAELIAEEVMPRLQEELNG